jgi:hypothetical protein
MKNFGAPAGNRIQDYGLEDHRFTVKLQAHETGPSARI